jgi:hypothetical protein
MKLETKIKQELNIIKEMFSYGISLKSIIKTDNISTYAKQIFLYNINLGFVPKNILKNKNNVNSKITTKKHLCLKHKQNKIKEYKNYKNKTVVLYSLKLAINKNKNNKGK